MIRPIRRKLRSHFGLTAKQVAVRSHRPWYFQGLLALAFVLLGFGVAYWSLHDGEGDQIRARLHSLEIEKKYLQDRLIESQSAHKIESSTSENLSIELSKAQDENIKLKEELMFYKNITHKSSK